jgi:mannosyltransferase
MVNETSPAPIPVAARPKISKLDSRPALRWTGLALIAAFAAHIRTHELTRRSFWLDEGVSAEIARLRWSQFFLVLWHREANMALYYALLHFWMKLGSGEAFVRGLSVLFGVATVPVIYALGRRLFGSAAGLIAAWLLAINAYAVFFSQEARSYALAIFLVSLSSWLLARNLQQPAAARWLAYAIVSALAVYAHIFAALVIFAQAASLLWLRGGRFAWRDYARSLRWIVYLTVPLAVAIAKIGGAPVNWIAPTSAHEVWNFINGITGLGGKWLVILDALALSVAAVAATRAWRASKRSPEVWNYALVLSWLVLPAVLTVLVSLIRPFFLSRYLIVCLPAAMLGVAAGVMRVHPRPLRWLLGAAISLLSILATHTYLHRGNDVYHEDWRSVTAYILDHAQPGDGIFFTPLARMPYEYYRSQRNPIPPGPVVLDSAGGNELLYPDFMVTPLGEVLSDARPAPGRVWVVSLWKGSPDAKSDRTTTILSAVYGKGRTLVNEQDFPNIDVRLFAVAATAPPK